MVKKVIVGVISLIILAGCNKTEVDIINLSGDLENQQQEISFDEKELETYLPYFYIQYELYANSGGSVYVSELVSEFYDLFRNQNDGVDATLVHDIIKETINEDMDKPLEAYILTEAQEKRVENGEKIEDIIDLEQAGYFIYSNSKDKYYLFTGSGSANIFARIVDWKKEEDVYTVTYNVWNAPGILIENYDIEELLENENIIREEDLNELRIMQESKQKVEIQLQENKDYKYSKYKMINFQIVNEK